MIAIRIQSRTGSTCRHLHIVGRFLYAKTIQMQSMHFLATAKGRTRTSLLQLCESLSDHRVQFLKRTIESRSTHSKNRINRVAQKGQVFSNRISDSPFDSISYYGITQNSSGNYGKPGILGVRIVQNKMFGCGLFTALGYFADFIARSEAIVPRKQVGLFRRLALNDPCGDELQEWRVRRGCACEHGNRGS